MKLNGKVILASGSPRRKQLLEQIGIEFECVPSDVEENITTDVSTDLVKILCKKKAVDVANKCKGQYGLVIGADTVVSYKGKTLGKPKSKEEAIEMLTMLQGNKHQVVTGVALVFPERKVTLVRSTHVFMYPMTHEQIVSYVETGEPMDKAGAYAIQGKGAAFVEKIDGDYNNVVGLPVSAILKLLHDMGIDI